MKKLFLAIIIVLLILSSQNTKADETASFYPYDVTIDEFWFREASTEYISDGSTKALLLMEYSTGKVLFAENEFEHLPIASVTKVISTLLVVEAIDSGKITLSDSVTVSEYAASMGGSQIFLQPNETMSVEDLLKSVIFICL